MGVMCRTTIRNNREVQPLDIHYPIGNILQKEVKTIVLITKNESVELQKLGYKFGSDGNLHKSKSRYPKYYLTESKKALVDLEKIRKSKIVAR